MDLLKGKPLIKKDGSQISSDDALKGKQVVALYFSAHWCPPCRMFTPLLADVYKELRDDDTPFEIIFVSSDRSPKDMLDYMKESHGDWFGVTHGSSLANELKEKFQVSGIPTLVILKSDGAVVTTNGRQDIQNKGPGAYKDWTA